MIMSYIKLPNGIQFIISFFMIKLVFTRIDKLQENKKYKLFLLQLNRFNNGYVSIYFRFFYRYSFSISGIKLKSGKRCFLGNKNN